MQKTELTSIADNGSVFLLFPQFFVTVKAAAADRFILSLGVVYSEVFRSCIIWSCSKTIGGKI